MNIGERRMVVRVGGESPLVIGYKPEIIRERKTIQKCTYKGLLYNERKRRKI